MFSLFFIEFIYTTKLHKELRLEQQKKKTSNIIIVYLDTCNERFCKLFFIVSFKCYGDAIDKDQREVECHLANNRNLRKRKIV
jgi:hypothetical protein